jgi:catechol 2,3-dioxygenase-like lactoylglutathione lyase family enzyme
VTAQLAGDQLHAVEPVAGLDVLVSIARHLRQEPTPSPPYNTPGVPGRANVHASAVYRENQVRPGKFGHVVIASTDVEASQQFFTRGIGFKISDEVPGFGTLMRCTTDHHNLDSGESNWESAERVGAGVLLCSPSSSILLYRTSFCSTLCVVQLSASERDHAANDATNGVTPGGVKAVDRALAILQTFDVSNERMSLAKLAKETGLYKTTILRLTRCLERGGFVHREPGPVRLGGAQVLTRLLGWAPR